MKQILLVGLGTQETPVRKALEDFRLQILSADARDLGQTIGSIFAREGREDPGEAMEPALIMFRDFSQKELDPVLKAIREAGLPRQPLKAMVTPTNRSWTLGQLYGELQQEQQVMGALIRLKALRDSIPMPDLMDIPAMQARFRAEHLLSGGQDATLENIEKAYRELEKFRK